jgi:hypothetical protein
MKREAALIHLRKKGETELCQRRRGALNVQPRVSTDIHEWGKKPHPHR